MTNSLSLPPAATVRSTIHTGIFVISYLSFVICQVLLLAADSKAEPLFLGQGTMAGEVTDSSVLLQTRLTRAAQLDAAMQMREYEHWEAGRKDTAEFSADADRKSTRLNSSHT